MRGGMRRFARAAGGFKGKLPVDFVIGLGFAALVSRCGAGRRREECAAARSARARLAGSRCPENGKAVNLLEFTKVQSEYFLLYFLRGAGFIFVIPFFSARGLPTQFKVALAGFLAYVFLAINQPLLPAAPMPMYEFVPKAVGELIIGLAMGFCVGLVFVAFQFAGNIFGYQMGLAIVNVLDPNTEEQVSLVGEFLFTVVALIFLNLNLHHAFIVFFGRGFEWVPVGGIDAAGFTLDGVARIATSLFITALQVAAPVVAALFMVDFGLGIIARVVPQMNVFLVGIPLKLGIGMFMLAVVVYLLEPVVWRQTDRFFQDSAAVVQSLG